MAIRSRTSPPDGGSSEDLKEVISVARAVVSQEFQIAERLDAKARGQVTLAGQWFAIVQAVLAVALSRPMIEHRWLLWAAAGSAVLGGVALAATVVLSWRVWRVREDHELAPAALLQMRDYATRGDSGLMGDLVQSYANILQGRRRTNKIRGDAQEIAERAWFFAMFVPLAELTFAVLAVLT